MRAKSIQHHLQEVIDKLDQNPNPPNTRSLKIQEVCRAWPGRGCYTSYRGYAPELRLQGKWMEQAGLLAGKRVQVYTFDRVLVICQEQEEGEDASTGPVRA